MIAHPIFLSDHILDQARAAASEDGVSLDQMLVSNISEGLGYRRGLKMMRGRAARADIGAVMAILDNVPDVPPEPGDEMPEAAGGSSINR